MFDISKNRMLLISSYFAKLSIELEGQFQNVHLIAFGGMSFIYQVGPGIVVKVPHTEDFARQQFCNELEIYKTFSQQPACAFIVQCFYYTDDGIFLEHMRGDTREIYGYKNIIIDQLNKWISCRPYLSQSQVRSQNLGGYPCG